MRSSWAVRCSWRLLARARPDPIHDPSRQDRVQQRMPRGHLADVAHQVRAADLLEHIPGRPGHDGVEERLVIGERGQHQTGHLRMARADVAAHFHAAAIRQPDVKDGHPRTREGDPLEGLLGGSGLAHHLHVAVRFQETAQPLANNLMVVEKEHPQPAQAVICRHRRDLLTCP